MFERELKRERIETDIRHVTTQNYLFERGGGGAWKTGAGGSLLDVCNRIALGALREEGEEREKGHYARVAPVTSSP